MAQIAPREPGVLTGTSWLDNVSTIADITMSNLNEPILPGHGATDYERYLRTDELLSLQKTPEQVVHRDEHLFQTVHQASELWLKLACLELEEATRAGGETIASLRRSV